MLTYKFKKVVSSYSECEVCTQNYHSLPQQEQQNLYTAPPKHKMNEARASERTIERRDRGHQDRNNMRV